MAKGMRKGIKQGMAEGRQESTLEIARKMKGMGDSIEKIHRK
jgi:predicted transposase YdaD